MPGDAPLSPIARLFEHSLSIRLVYGEPVRQGDTTVIPVARVAFGFGAGGGGGRRDHTPEAAPEDAPVEIDAQGFGSGGGGGARLTPVGALEIGPRGTRFVRVRPLAPLLATGAAGLALGWLLRRST